MDGGNGVEVGQTNPEQETDDADNLRKRVDLRLFRRAQSGDRSALEEMCRSTWKPIYLFIAQRCDSRAEAEDLTQSVFLRVLTTLPTVEERGIPFEAYLFRSARNLLIDRWRASPSPTIALHTLSDSTSADESPETAADQAEQRRELVEAFAKLSSAHQQVLRLRLVEGHSAADVALILGSTAPAIRQMQLRAVSALRSAMNQRPAVPPSTEMAQQKDGSQ